MWASEADPQMRVAAAAGRSPQLHVTHPKAIPICKHIRISLQTHLKESNIHNHDHDCAEYSSPSPYKATWISSECPGPWVYESHDNPSSHFCERFCCCWAEAARCVLPNKGMDPHRVYWGYMGIMEKKMETTIRGYIGVIWG